MIEMHRETKAAVALLLHVVQAAAFVYLTWPRLLDGLSLYLIVGIFTFVAISGVPEPEPT